ncbi:hypothetical protein [Marimonas arenosa]|uniref:Uncharacterized protein n=1 Tax=Marimonas arenosa TaxID=1795305 RepID=A0AAE4B5S4_9RHOB|nr:hypothetical protein [Marimonas arenosa]MDQ2092313.1 hypothetical protein [Marimonas arenosa]
MLVSEVVGETAWKRYPKPKPLPIPGPTKPKQRAKPKKRKQPAPFNRQKPEELS